MKISEIPPTPEEMEWIRRCYAVRENPIRILKKRVKPPHYLRWLPAGNTNAANILEKAAWSIYIGSPHTPNPGYVCYLR
jgi:hypothetical protein